MRINSSGDVEIMQAKKLRWVFAGGSTHRCSIGGEAIALVEVDGKIDEKIISEIRNLPQVARVNTINFEGK